MDGKDTSSAGWAVGISYTYFSPKLASSYLLTLSGGPVPGVGKDTQCERFTKALLSYTYWGLASHSNYTCWFSLLKIFIQESIDVGFVVPADLVIRLILAEAKGRKLLLNGFPKIVDIFLSIRINGRGDVIDLFLITSSRKRIFSSGLF